MVQKQQGVETSVAAQGLPCVPIGSEATREEINGAMKNALDGHDAKEEAAPAQAIQANGSSLDCEDEGEGFGMGDEREVSVRW